MNRLVCVGVVSAWMCGAAAAAIAPDDHAGFAAELKKAREFHRTHPKDWYRIRFAAGTWRMSGTLALGKDDAYVVLEPEPGAEVFLDGGVEVTGWEPWAENPSILTAPLPEGTPRVGPQQDFGAAFYMGVKDFPCDELRYTGDLYADGEPLVAARWPNAGTVCFDRGDTTNRLVTFRNERVKRWAKAKDPMALGWWEWRYKEAATRIRIVDAEKGVFRLMDDASPAPGKKTPTVIQDIGNPFFVFNMLEELDVPGEWHFDADEQRLYVWPKAKGARYVFPVFDRTFVTVRDTHHVIVRGFVFRNGRQHAVRFLNATDCAFAGNRVERFGGFALLAQETFGLRVQDNVMRLLSHGGMVVRANHDDPRPSGIVVLGNDVSRFMLRARSYCPALYLEANGALVSHNFFHDGASSAIRLEGSQNTVEYNRIERVVQESDDQGGLDIYGNPYYFGNVIRYNLWKDFGGGDIATMQGGVRLDDGISDTLVLGNVFDNACRGTFGAVQINGGNGNVICSNVVRNCAHFLSGQAWTQELHWLADRYERFFNPTNKPAFMRQVLAIPEPPADRVAAIADKSRHDVNDVFGNRLHNITGEVWASEKMTSLCRTNDNVLCRTAAEAKGPVPERLMGLLPPVGKARIFARRKGDGRELYLGPVSAELPLPSLSDVPTDVLPAGEYEVVVRLNFMAEPEGRFLVSRAGRSVITVEGLDLSDYEFSCRVSDELGFAMRAQPGLTQSPETWKWYETGAFPSRRNRTAKVVNARWKTLGNELPLGAVAHRAMHDVRIRCEGTNLTVTIDGNHVVRTDPENTYPRGTIAFRSPDSGLSCYVGDVKVTDLKTGRTLFADDFADGLVKWRTAGGAWDVSRGYPETYDVPLGTVSVKAGTKKSLAQTKVVREGDDQALFVDGRRELPLFFSNGLGYYAYSPDVYDVVKRTYDTGLRFFASQVNASDMRAVDDIMAQVLAQCPEAKFLLRVATPVPGDLPKGDHIRMADGSGDLTRRDWVENSKVENSVSLASEYYRTNSTPKIVDDLAGHFAASPHADHLLGLLLTGGGYEGNWGAGGIWPKYLVDLCDAELEGYGRFLKAKYGAARALQEAWGRPDASFARPPVPSFRERTISHVGGFRDPSRRESRWIDDFLDFYTYSAQWRTMYDRLRLRMPDSFHASFGGGPCLNASFGIMQARVPANARGWDPVSALVSIETYGDRGKGGVSICTDYGNESVRRAGHFHLQELDLHPPDGKSANYGWEDLANVFRREFAVQVLMRRDAMWYFDMGYTGPWYDHPVALREIAEDVRVGRKYLGVPRKKATEAVLVQDGRMLKYYAMSPTPWTSEANIPYATPIHYYENFATHAPEGAMRLGAAVDGINWHDLEAFKDAYRLYVFPVSGYMTRKERRLVRALAERGATCVLMGPSGLVDEERASLENMRELTGMRIGVGPIGPQQAFLKDGTRIGAARWFDNSLPASWHTFFIDDPAVKPLAAYKDGRTALGMVRVGKGRIVYSGVSLTLPSVYRSLAKKIGIHVYLDTDDFTYADANFVTIHAKTSGMKHVVLRDPVSEVREIFSDRVIARDAVCADLELKEGETAVLYLKK